MRVFFALLLLPTLAFAQTAEEKKATIQFIEGLRDKETGAYKDTPKEKPSLHATNGGVKSLRALGEKVTEIEKIQKFVLKCYDPKTGVFAEPDGKADATITSIGIIVACEVGIDHKEFPKAPKYLKDNAKTFEEVRICAAALEAWRRKAWPEEIEAWENIVGDTFKEQLFEKAAKIDDHESEFARLVSSFAVSWLRFNSHTDLGELLEPFCKRIIFNGQVDDGGWRKKGEKASDIESTYRVMRAFKMLDSKPKDIPQLRKFIASHRNKDGGYATKPGDPSSMSGVYYVVNISKWIDEMEMKK